MVLMGRPGIPTCLAAHGITLSSSGHFTHYRPITWVFKKIRNAKNLSFRAASLLGQGCSLPNQPIKQEIRRFFQFGPDPFPHSMGRRDRVRKVNVINVRAFPHFSFLYRCNF